MRYAMVDERIFGKYPGFRRGIVIARNIDNGTDCPELERMLAAAVERARLNPVDPKEDPRIAAWQEAHRNFGSNPNKFPPAHCSLLKRVQRPESRLPFINKVVAVMNLVSISGVLPVGGDDLGRAGGSLLLTYAEGTESFIPLDAPETEEKPGPGAGIYLGRETGQVMCRRWNWRNGYGTRITEETRELVMNIDGIGGDAEERALKYRDEVAGLLAEFCGASVETGMLSPSRPSYPIG